MTTTTPAVAETKITVLFSTHLRTQFWRRAVDTKKLEELMGCNRTDLLSAAKKEKKYTYTYRFSNVITHMSYNPDGEGPSFRPEPPMRRTDELGINWTLKKTDVQTTNDHDSKRRAAVPLSAQSSQPRKKKRPKSHGDGADDETDLLETAVKDLKTELGRAAGQVKRSQESRRVSSARHDEQRAAADAVLSATRASFQQHVQIATEDNDILECPPLSGSSNISGTSSH
jgi:hypothetical protein